MPSKNNNNNSGLSNKTSSSTTITVSTQLPGIDNTLVIASKPYLIRENSQKPEGGTSVITEAKDR